MKAGELTLQGTLTAQQQYVIPIFQRYYTWDRKEWDQLWTDICELREKPGKRHFMGALVFVPDKTPVTYSYPTYQVIDGQQRIITFSLLLSALRNVCTQAGHHELAAEITNSVLVHPYKKGYERLRVYPRQRDRDDFAAAIDGTAVPGNRVGKAIRIFNDEIIELLEEDDVNEVRAFYNFLLNGLEFVHINLDGESPYKIFRSLNSTGVDLSPADLIRNFVFTQVPIEQQDDYDRQLWSPLEGHFQNGKSEVNAKQVTSFFRDFLMADGQHFAPADTFESFEARYKGGFDARALAIELNKSVVLYDYIRGTQDHPDERINLSLTKLHQLDSSTAYPLILKLMSRLETEQITVEQFVSCMELLVGYVFRRYICGETSRAYSKWLVAACKGLASGNSDVELEQFLTLRGAFPADGRFKASLGKFDLYSSKYAFAVLQQLEMSFGCKEAPDPEKATIEHIMPQTLSKEWKDDLGPEARTIRDEWVHTLGNLTLSGYNTGLGNKTFSVKMEGIGDTPGYKRSNFELTKTLLGYERWGAEEIQSRAKSLADRAASIWSGPKLHVVEESKELPPENPFRDGATKFKVFTVLLDGQWHSIQGIQEQFSWDVLKRVDRITTKGLMTGRWRIERDGDLVRVVFQEPETMPEYAAGTEGEDDLSDRQQKQLKFWTAFSDFLESSGSDIRHQAPGPRSWMWHSIGKGGYGLSSVASFKNSLTGAFEREIRVDFELFGEHAKQRYVYLEQRRDEINQKFGGHLLWFNDPNVKRSYIYIRNETDFLREELWPDQHKWLKDTLESFLLVFMPYIEQIESAEISRAAAGGQL